MAQQTARLPPPWGHWAGHVLASSPPLTPTEMVGRGRFLNSWILKNDAESHSETVLLSRSPTDACSFNVRGRAVAWEENLQKPVLRPFNKIKKQAAEKKIQSSRTLESQRGPREGRLQEGSQVRVHVLPLSGVEDAPKFTSSGIAGRNRRPLWDERTSLPPVIPSPTERVTWLVTRKTPTFLPFWQLEDFR